MLVSSRLMKYFGKVNCGNIRHESKQPPLAEGRLFISQCAVRGVTSTVEFVKVLPERGVIREDFAFCP